MTGSALPTFDHVAIAVRSIASSRAFIEDVLLPRPVGGSEASGFRWHQWRFVNGMKLELLEPFREAESDFLQRFIRTAGPGAHHLTFRVADIHEAADTCRRAGFPILYVRDSDPDWKEAFIHPRDTSGTLIQLAESPDHDGTARPGQGRALERVDVDVTDLERARLLYEDVLGGTMSGSPDHLSGAVTLSWPGSGSIRLLPSAAGSPGGIRRLAFTGGHRSDANGTTPGDHVTLREDLGIEMHFS